MLQSETCFVKHRFLDHKIAPLTETLIIGTFNPDATKNKADFFYSTGRNYLWRILPAAFGECSLEGKSREEKKKFILSKRIDFVDLIECVEVDQGREEIRDDTYIDSKVRAWANCARVVAGLPELKRACFTRKTFARIPNIKNKIEAVSDILRARDVDFKCIISPARYYNETKQLQWNTFLNSG